MSASSTSRNPTASELVASLPGDAARAVGGITGRLIGMQSYAETAALLGISRDAPEDFAEYLVRLGRAQGDEVVRERRDGAAAGSNAWLRNGACACAGGPRGRRTP